MDKLRLAWFLEMGGKLRLGDVVAHHELGVFVIEEQFDIDVATYYRGAAFIPYLCYREGRHIGTLKNVCTPTSDLVRRNCLPDIQLLITLQNISVNSRKR